MISKGSEEFSQLPKTGVEWAQLLGVTTATVSRWKSGKIRPDAAMRLKIHQLGGPEPASWDLKPTGVGKTHNVKKRRGKAKLTPATTQGVMDEASLTLAHCRDLRERISSANLDLSRETRLLADNTKTLVSLGKLTGVGLQLSRNAIIDSPNFRLILEVFTDALKPWPDALKAVLQALKDLDTR